MNRKCCDIYEQMTNNNWDVIEKFVADGGDINSSLVSTGPQAGYTVLHFAAMKSASKYLERLVKTYGANVNSKGADGAQPLHLACLRGNENAAEILLELGADANAVLTREVVEKYNSCVRDWKWSDDFDEMTLVTLLTINYRGLDELAILMALVQYKANIEIKDKNNKTLLMYGAEIGHYKYLGLFTDNYGKCKPEFINARDNKGRHAVHYLLSNEKFGEFRYRDDFEFSPLCCCLLGLIEAGADINAMVDNDPDTLLINTAAYRYCYRILEFLLELRYPFSADGRPLKNFMIPVDPGKMVKDINQKRRAEKERNECLEIILKNYLLRQEFGLFVPDEEIKLMDQLITKEEIKKIVDDFKVTFIDKLKIKFIAEDMTVYDLAVKVLNKRSLKLLVKNEKIVEGFDDFFLNKIKHHEDKFWFYNEMLYRISEASKRRKFMEEVEKISHLRKVIPLPYEIILMIVEYLNNDSLKNFVNSFYQNVICE